jgi:hypothetical protein
MAYFIFIKNTENITADIYRIAEDQTYLNNININQNDYTIIQDSQSNFLNVKYGTKFPSTYSNNTITYIDLTWNFSKVTLQDYINNFKNLIKQFTTVNPNHPLYNQWNNYYSQLNNLNLDNITYPLEKSLEQYFNDLGQPSLNPLQVP